MGSRFFAAMLLCGSALSARAADDVFSALRVKRISPPRSVGKEVLHAEGGGSIKLASLQGKVVVIEFFLPS